MSDEYCYAITVILSLNINLLRRNYKTNLQFGEASFMVKGCTFGPRKGELLLPHGRDNAFATVCVVSYVLGAKDIWFAHANVNLRSKYLLHEP